MSVVFLSLAQVVEIHQDQVIRYGGDPGIRDLNLLKSAVAMPMAMFNGEFMHTDIFEMAAAYLYHLVKNHPFVDGNKRVGAVAAIVFLSLNGYTFNAPSGALFEFVISLASGEKTKMEAAFFLRKYS